MTEDYQQGTTRTKSKKYEQRQIHEAIVKEQDPSTAMKIFHQGH
jgi:hypothetical protein